MWWRLEAIGRCYFITLEGDFWLDRERAAADIFFSSWRFRSSWGTCFISVSPAFGIATTRFLSAMVRADFDFEVTAPCVSHLDSQSGESEYNAVWYWFIYWDFSSLRSDLRSLVFLAFSALCDCGLCVHRAFLLFDDGLKLMICRNEPGIEWFILPKLGLMENPSGCCLISFAEPFPISVSWSCMGNERWSFGHNLREMSKQSSASAVFP